MVRQVSFYLRDEHVKGLESDPIGKRRAEGLEGVSWILRECVDELILGDSACFFQTAGERRFKPFTNKDDAVVKIFLPLSTHQVLVGTRGGRADDDLDVPSINRAAAGCSVEFFISSSRQAVDSELMGLIGAYAGLLSDGEMSAILEDSLKGALPSGMAERSKRRRTKRGR